MGIRYYAYAFDREMTKQALANPQSILAADPFADALGLEPGFSVGVTNFKQAVPERDMLYLDKAWRPLQILTAPTSPDAEVRPAHRMFQGDVTFSGMESTPCVRALPPDDVVSVARDIGQITDADVESRLQGTSESSRGLAEELSYALEYLRRAQTFVANLVSSDRGMVYMIG